MYYIDLESYCDGCPYFEPKISPPTMYFAEGELFTTVVNENVKCIHSDICKRIAEKVRKSNEIHNQND